MNIRWPNQMPQPGSMRNPSCCVSPEHHRADEGAPEGTHAADDHRLEGEEQQQRPVRRRDRRAQGLEDPGDGDDDEGDAVASA